MPQLTRALLLTLTISAQICGQDCSQVAGDEITLQLVSSALRSPVDIQSIPGDFERLFVVEQRGDIRILRLSTNQVDETPLLAISGLVEFGGEQGLLGLAFDRNFADNGFFFVNYTQKNSDNTIVSRFEVTDDPDVADPESELILLEVNQVAGNHNGGQIAFRPSDGFLYVGMGDGGSGCDPPDLAQNPLSLLGKMLRLDVSNLNPDAEPVYAIPEDNPFVGVEGILPEIWASGLRNPWRFSFDSETSELFIGDVGQNRREEISYAPGSSVGGENYGWRTREGIEPSSVSNCSPSRHDALGPFVDPIFDYPHGSGRIQGCSVTGGVVYRGCRIPDLHGAYFFADFCNSWVATFNYEFDPDAPNAPVADVVDRTNAMNDGIDGNISSVSCFGQDARGEVYIGSLGGRLYRVIPLSEINREPVPSVVTTPDPAEVAITAEPAEVILDASASTDGDDGSAPLSFEWSRVRGPGGHTIVEPTAASTSILFTDEGEYRFRVTVSDGERSSAMFVDVSVSFVGPPILRGDSNHDGDVDVSDALFTLEFLFVDLSIEPVCRDATDSNDDGDIDVSDAIHVLNALFTIFVPSPPLECATDTTDDDMKCLLSSCLDA